MFITVFTPTEFLKEPEQQSQYNDSLWAGRSGVRILAEERLALGTPKSPIQWALEFYPRGKQPGPLS